MAKRLSRRDFARASVAAGAAVALPSTLLSAAPSETIVAETARARPVAARGAAAAAMRRRVVPPPPNVAYGGDMASAAAEFRDAIMLANSPALSTGVGQAAASYPGGWREGLTIPAEYYVDEKWYTHDERFLSTHLWFLADHVSRIPKPGDFFVFEYGRGDSVIVLRDKGGEVRAFHNVCRHRGSRLCRHEGEPAPKDPRLSVLQLGSSGNTPVFRCPYHAWTYDLEGKLISAPNGMAAEFDLSQNGLRPCHVRTTEGFIFLNLSSQDAPEFDSAIKNFATVAKEYGTADLKLVARLSAPTKANWKLVLENFQECYHCGPAHRSLVTTHPFWNGLTPNEQKDRLAKQLERFIPPGTPGEQGGQAQGGMAQGPSAGLGGNILNVNFVTGSVDGKAVAPLLPARKEWTHRSRAVSTGWSTGYLQCYDDHVACVRFTPRGVKSTDAELFYLVAPHARERDVQVDRMTALWDLTYQEDRWITENNHSGIESQFYSAGPYAAVETGPTRFVTWYMKEIIGTARATADQP